MNEVINKILTNSMSWNVKEVERAIPKIIIGLERANNCATIKRDFFELSSAKTDVGY